MILRDLALACRELHNQGWVHADFKPRNAVRIGTVWLLIDLDAATPIGGELGHKRSTGYCAPELIKLGGALLPDAQPTFDVWSFGVVAYLLFTGQSLFALDALDDNIVDSEQQRLAQWRGIEKSCLAKVFSAVKHDLEGEELKSAQDLVEWCLEPDPNDRPHSMVQILSHRFLKPTGGLLREAAKEASCCRSNALRMSLKGKRTGISKRIDAS